MTALDDLALLGRLYPCLSLRTGSDPTLWTVSTGDVDLGSGPTPEAAIADTIKHVDTYVARYQAERSA